MEIRHGKFKLSQNFSSTSREFMDSKIFNTLTCNKICTPLNFFALRPIKTRKTYHRKITKVLK